MRDFLATAAGVTLGAALALSCGSTPGKRALRADGGAGGDERANGSGGSADNQGGEPSTSMGGVPNDAAGAPSASVGESGSGGALNGSGGEAGAGASVPLRLVYNTGVDDSGAPLPGGSVDPHYTLITSADPTFTGPDAIVPSQIAEGYWLAQSDTSKWIAPSVNQSFPTPDPCNAAGVYVYRTTFSLTAEQAATFALVGHWGADNAGTDVLLNDVSLGITAASYTPLSPFTVDTGFVTGVNTLDFKITDLGCPNGLRVELTPSL